MEQRQIQSIRPDHPRRVNDSPYVATRTRVRATDVSIEQVAKLVWRLQEEAPGLTIPELRIWSESDSAVDWEAELSLVALAYSPSDLTGR